MAWAFKDFVSPAGRNLIHEWLEGLPARARINARIRLLELTDELRFPDVRILRGECRGLFELRVKADNVQYRPLGYYGPGRGEVTLLIGAVERGGHFEPPSACRTALDRQALIADGRGSTCEHDFS